MKSLIHTTQLFILLVSASIACKERKPVEIVTAAEEIKSSDSSAVITPDSTTLDQETQETALQQDPPPAEDSKAVVTVKKCEPNFTLIGKPGKMHQIYY